MVDVRSIIKADSGWIKKLQSFLPGYKKYRSCEDLRSADNILRKELAAKLEIVENNIKRSREEISKEMDFDLINRIGELVNISHKITEKVRHAEQGYTPWISGDVRIEEDELNGLYEFDLSLVENIETLIIGSKDLEKASINKVGNKLDMIVQMRSSLQDFENLFSQRIAKVTEVAQTK